MSALANNNYTCLLRVPPVNHERLGTLFYFIKHTPPKMRWWFQGVLICFALRRRGLILMSVLVTARISKHYVMLTRLQSRRTR